MQEQINREAKKKGIEAPVVTAPVMPERERVTRTETGSSYQTKRWTFEIVDQEKVPRDYLMVDNEKIRKAVQGGIRSIPGVKIFEKVVTSFRT